MRDSDRTRPAGRAMERRLFEQVRHRYFLLSPGTRRAIHVGVLAGALVLALVAGWSLPSTLVVTVLLLGYGALAMRFPAAPRPRSWWPPGRCSCSPWCGRSASRPRSPGCCCSAR